MRAQRNQRRFAEGRAATLCDALRRSIRRAAIAGRSSRRARKSDVERHDGDAPVQVGAKLAGLDRFAWSRTVVHHARRSAARCSAQRLDLALLQHAPGACLSASGSVDVIEHQRPPSACRKRPIASMGARERADLVSNNSASTSVGQSRQADRHQRPAAPGAELVQRAPPCSCRCRSRRGSARWPASAAAAPPARGTTRASSTSPAWRRTTRAASVSALCAASRGNRRASIRSRAIVDLGAGLEHCRASFSKLANLDPTPVSAQPAAEEAG